MTFRSALALLAGAATALGAQNAPPSGLIGFAPGAVRAQREAEAAFVSGVSTAAMSEIHRQVTRRPHVAGSAGSMEVADTVRRALEAAGLETEVHEYSVLLSTPVRVEASITSPSSQALRVIEPPHPADPDSAHAELGPGYVAYSASGSVTAPVVYVHYGLPPDYEALESQGVDVKGRIVLARYGRSHRAVKLHTAERAGAAGIIIYSDPADDGASRGPAWPSGPWRAGFQIQRGNGKYSWFWHGDPLSPGFAATADATMLDAADVPTLPRIPAVVLSADEARKIRSRLVAPDAVTVRLDVQMRQDRRPIRNVIGRLTGRDAQRYVILGTHHDAWTFGGMDPGSGLAAVFEVARGLGALRKQGWTPARSLVFAFWDAEEFGLIGSTEFAEAFAAELRERVVAYINTDLYMKGRFDGGGTPSLRDFLVEVTKDVPSFAGGGSVYDGWRAQAKGDVELAALGSGADFVAFQDFLGLPTLQMEFDFEGSYGTYHSNYDTRRYVEQFSDPGFLVGRTLVQVLGLSMMRLASASVLPFRYSHYARTIRGLLTAADAWPGAAAATLDLARARELADAIAQSAARLESRLAARLAHGKLTPADARTINDRLVGLEQMLLDESESADRRWYRHVIYGWNIYSLYEGQAFPGVAEAVRRGDPAQVRREVSRLEAALSRMLEALSAVEGGQAVGVGGSR